MDLIPVIEEACAGLLSQAFGLPVEAAWCFGEGTETRRDWRFDVETKEVIDSRNGMRRIADVVFLDFGKIRGYGYPSHFFDGGTPMEAERFFEMITSSIRVAISEETYGWDMEMPNPLYGKTKEEIEMLWRMS